MWKDLIDLVVQQLSRGNYSENGLQFKIKAECRFLCMINKTIRDSTVSKLKLFYLGWWWFLKVHWMCWGAPSSYTRNVLAAPSTALVLWYCRRLPSLGSCNENGEHCSTYRPTAARQYLWYFSLVLEVGMAKAIRRGEQSCLYWPLAISPALGKLWSSVLE